MIQQILTILIIACAAFGLWAYVRKEQRHSCACGGSCSDASDGGCSACALKQQCCKAQNKVIQQ
ncbi:MAG: hypothetical protein IJS92_09055 [Paludibacteraceae bacterium]|nr:hypothetical protein [Paludibacteraceae bacterium]